MRPKPLLWIRERLRGQDNATAEPSEALFRAMLVRIGLVVLPVLLFALYARATTRGLSQPDALDLAQLGRNLSEGRGYVTYILRPLALTHGSNPLRQPELLHSPLYPFCLALMFGARGVQDSVAAQTAGLFYLLTIPAIYVLGRRLFNRVVGRYAALLFTVNALYLDYAASGRHITLCAFLVTCLFLTLHTVARNGLKVDGGERPRPAWLLAGALTALLYLTDPIFCWIAPTVLVVVVRMNPDCRFRAARNFCLPLLALALPWMLRNALLGTNPIFGLRAMDIWAHTLLYTDNFVYRAFPNALMPGEAMLNAVARKMLFNASLSVDTLPQVAASWIVAFFLPSLLFRFRDAATHTVRNGMLLCLLTLFFGMLPMQLDMPLLASFAPTMLVFAVAYLLHLVQQANLSRSAMVLVMLFAGASALFPVLRNMLLTDRPALLQGRAESQILLQEAKRDEVSLSDVPWIAAWYADRPSVWIPAEDWDVAAVRKGYPTTRWLFLTEETRHYSPGWKYVYDGFERWNVEYLDARQQHIPPPVGIAIVGTKLPILEALSGFASVSPLPEGKPQVVIATVRPENQER